MIFKRPKQPDFTSRHLFVGNCGPSLGFNEDDIRRILCPYTSSGSADTLEVHMPWSEGKASHVYVSFRSQQEAARAIEHLSGRPCEAAGGRVLMVKYAAVEEPKQAIQRLPVALSSAEAGIPGLQIHTDFITPQEEQAILQQIDQQPWTHLAKRRVQHYGYKFKYSQRGVDPRQNLGSLPEWVQPLQQRLEALPDIPQLDQLTVNEYTPGVGLSAHIDTHSAFTGAILSLSLAGGCVMEFRKPISSCSNSSNLAGSNNSSTAEGEDGSGVTGNDSIAYSSKGGVACVAEVPAEQGLQGTSTDTPDGTSADAAAAAGMQQVLVYLPPRALLVMGGESRYAWQHYIPHRKSDWVNGKQIPRAARRVSLTFRKVRGYACDCIYPEFCDSQLGVLPPTRISQLQQQQDTTTPAQASDQQEATAAAAAANGHGAEAASGSSPADADAAAAAMEAVHVVQVYDAIAGHFSSTRFAVWPKVRAFLESLPANAVVADVGCGNGKYFGVRRDLAVLGSDRSEGLAGVAMHRLRGGKTAAATGQAPIYSPAADVLVCDGLQLPYRAGCCDAVLCIAVLHHMGSKGRRLKLLQELAAVLVPGGKGLVTVWATEQEDPDKTIKKWKKIKDSEGLQEQQQQQDRLQDQQQSDSAAASSITGPDYMVPWHLPFHKAAGLVKQQQQEPQQLVAAATAVDHPQDNGNRSLAVAGIEAVRVDEAKGAVVLQRYYHLFEQFELDGLVHQVPGLKVVDSFYDRSNWCVIVQKQ